LINFDQKITNEEVEEYSKGWRIHRVREERDEPNATRTAHSVVESIENYVE
jgi:hypothetical protein